MNRPAFRAAAWYLVVGGVTALGYFATAAWLHQHWGMTLQWANFIAIMCMHPFSYLGHRYFTFQYSGPWTGSILRFAGVAGVSTAVSIFLSFSQFQAGVGFYEALAVNCFMIPAITFVLYRWWVFGRSRQGHPDGNQDH